MVAVMVDRTAFRRLRKTEWQAETRLIDWARIVRRDRAPCDERGKSVLYDSIRAADPWLTAARSDPWQEPDWFAEFNAQLRERFQGVRMTFLRRRYVEHLPTDQARLGLNMSRHAAHKVLADARKLANESLGA